MIFTGDYDQDREKLVHFLERESITLDEFNKIFNKEKVPYDRDYIVTHDSFIKYHGIPSFNKFTKMSNKIFRVIYNFGTKYKNNYTSFMVSYKNLNKFFIKHEIKLRVAVVRVRDKAHATKLYTDDKNTAKRSIYTYWILVQTDVLDKNLLQIPEVVINNRYSLNDIQEYEQSRKELEQSAMLQLNMNKEEENVNMSTTPFNGLPIDALLRAKTEVQQKELEKEFEEKEEQKEPERLSELQQRLANKHQNQESEFRWKIDEDKEYKDPVNLETEPVEDPRIMKPAVSPAQFPQDPVDRDSVDEGMLRKLQAVMNSYSIFTEKNEGVYSPNINLIMDIDTVKVLIYSTSIALRIIKQIMLFKGHKDTDKYRLFMDDGFIMIYRNESMIGSIMR